MSKNARLEQRLVVVDLIGQTLQREGRWEGRPVAQIRLAGCNLACKWCDVPYSWDYDGRLGIAYPQDMTTGTVPISELISWATQCTRIVITGGEPMLQHEPLRALSEEISERTMTEIETNGTISPEGFDYRVRFSVSLKLSNSGNPWNRAIKPRTIAEFNDRRADFKFTISDVRDLSEVLQLQTEFGIDAQRIWVMPEARSIQQATDKLDWLTVEAESRGWSLSTRLISLAHELPTP